MRSFHRMIVPERKDSSEGRRELSIPIHWGIKNYCKQFYSSSILFVNNLTSLQLTQLLLLPLPPTGVSMQPPMKTTKHTNSIIIILLPHPANRCHQGTDQPQTPPRHIITCSQAVKEEDEQDDETRRWLLVGRKPRRTELHVPPPASHFPISPQPPPLHGPSLQSRVSA